MLFKYSISFILLILAIGQAVAQKLDVQFSAISFLDNREYKEFTERSRTYSGSRVAIDFGLALDSSNNFRFGANGLHEFGAKPFFKKVEPVIYYQYQSKRWLFNAGAFPREGLISDFPRALLNDTLRYFRPNIEGLLARYETNRFNGLIFIDWLSRQTATDREQFIFGTSGKYRIHQSALIYSKYFFYMFHDAGAAIKAPDDRIRDNGVLFLKLGLDLTHKQTILDSLTIDAGGILSLERTRGVTGFRKPLGFVSSVYLSYKRFSLYDEFYRGQGHYIIYGDAYYAKKLYNRIDLIYTPFLFKKIKGQFIFSFHQTSASAGSNQQAFRVTYDLGRLPLAKVTR